MKATWVAAEFDPNNGKGKKFTLHHLVDVFPTLGGENFIAACGYVVDFDRSHVSARPPRLGRCKTCLAIADKRRHRDEVELKKQRRRRLDRSDSCL